MRIPHAAEQTAIFILTVGGIALTTFGTSDPVRFWGSVAGACSSGFWIHSGLSARPRQFGSVATSIALLALWLAGMVRYW